MSEKIAMLILDVQVGMFSTPDPVYKGKELLEKISGLITKARAAQVPIIYVQHRGQAGHILEYGTPGWKIHPDIAPLNEDVIIHKQTPDSFHNTDLQSVLNSRGINSLIVCGIQTEFCVDTTCRRAFSLGYNVTLVKDAIAPGILRCSLLHRLFCIITIP